MTSLPEKLKEFRVHHRYSQEYISNLLNISRQGYAHYETGDRKPAYESLLKLADLYQVTLEELIDNVVVSSDLTRENPNDSYSILDPRCFTLSNNQKKLLYLFSQFSTEDQDDFLSYMQIKSQNNKKRRK